MHATAGSDLQLPDTAVIAAASCPTLRTFFVDVAPAFERPQHDGIEELVGGLLGGGSTRITKNAGASDEPYTPASAAMPNRSPSSSVYRSKR